MTDTTTTCPYCQHTRPEHDQHCPVQELTDGLTRAATAGEPFTQTVDLPTDPDELVAQLNALWDTEDEHLTFAPIDTEE